MRALGLIDRGLARLVSWVAQGLLWSAVAAGFYQVLARFIFESPSAWSEAWTRASIIWAVMLGVSLAFRQGAMLSVDLLHNVLAPYRARLLEHLILLIVLILLLIGALPSWPHSRGWGYYPSGGLGLVLLVVLILMLMGRI